MRVVSVVGARPQFVKLAPVADAAVELGIDHVVVHTGQHYDHGMPQSFFYELGIPAPDVKLEVGSSLHGAQTGAMIAMLEPVIEKHELDWVFAYGDTNSTLAAAVVSTKLGAPLAHLEAGLRSFNRRMPEEHNRVLTDHAIDVCLAPTEIARQHFEREGLGERSVVVGDVMVDVMLRVASKVEVRAVDSPIDRTEQDFTVATIQRPDHMDDPGRLAGIVDALAGLNGNVYLAAHSPPGRASRGRRREAEQGRRASHQATFVPTPRTGTWKCRTRGVRLRRPLEEGLCHGRPHHDSPVRRRSERRRSKVAGTSSAMIQPV